MTKYHYILFYAFLGVFLFACQGEPKTNTESAENTKTDTLQIDTSAMKEANVIDPCTLLDKAFIHDHFEVGDQSVDISPRKGGNNTFGKNCIARWMTDKNLRGQSGGSYEHHFPGIAVQWIIWSGEAYASKQWAKNRIDAYLEKGVRVSGEPMSYTFEPIEGIGEEAAWCSELSHLTWRYGEDAFDLYYYNPVDPEQRKNKAVEMAKDLMVRFTAMN